MSERHRPGQFAPTISPDAAALFAGGSLIAIGVVMSYSTTATMNLDSPIPPLFLQHVGAVAAGLAIGALAFSLPITAWQRLALPFWAICMLLLAATAIFGVEVNGAQRWLPIPGLDLRFQPVEPAKCATLLAIAAMISTRQGHEELSSRRAMAAVALTLPPIVLLIGQPDLGNAVLLAVLVALLLVVAGFPLAKLIAPGLLGAGAIALYISTHDYARRRMTGFLDPWQNPLDEGFQLVQSYVAFGGGGFFGVGLGNSHQKLAYLPEAHTDFILALVAEELGLVGVLVVLGGFAALLFAGTRIARHGADRFTLLVAFGLTAMLTVPALVNGAVVMGLVPTKGLTLPFLSYGRTSLITNCFALGVLLAAARPVDGRTRTVSWR